MKITAFIKIYPILFLFFFSCNKIQSVDHLEEAQRIIKKNPEKALELLNLIKAPEEMSIENYMQYIIAKTQAKCESSQDITSDTLVFEAQRYFENKRNPNQAVLAHFYAGRIYNQNEMFDKAMECFLQAAHCAKQVNNNLIAGRSLNNIGFLYFEQDVMDSAIVHYQEALDYFNKEKDATTYKLHVIASLGHSYEIINELDSAYLYLNKGLEQAIQDGDKRHEALFTQDLGVVFLKKKKYNKATEYFHRALTQTKSTEDSVKLYLNLSIVYNNTNQLDSTKYYTDMLKKKVSEVTDYNTLRVIYDSFIKYNKRSGNFEEALYFSKMESSISKKIISSNSAVKLLGAEKRYTLSLQEQEYSSRLSLIIILGATLITVIVSIACWINIRTWINRQKLRLENHRLKTENLFLTQQYVESIYTDFIAKWIDIKKRMKLYLGKEQKIYPSAFLEVDMMVEEIKNQKKEQLIELAKSYLLNYSNGVGERAIRMLTDKDLILMMLCYFKYPQPIMISILETTAAKFDLEERKLSIQSKLLNAGMTEEQINPVLFSKGFH